jgi:alkanesulfonate monooxygenase SsuD/methylene tetrahydromethanopterin reductase-like flavin-dependent oxidoreductase (luciferase family)
MNQHSQAGNTQAAALTDDFLESFCIFGPPGHCVERLQALADVGVDYVIAQSAPVGVPNETLIPIERALSADVLPHVA